METSVWTLRAFPNNINQYQRFKKVKPFHVGHCHENASLWDLGESEKLHVWVESLQFQLMVR